MAAERNLGSLETRAEPGARVEQHGIRLGTVADLIFDRGLRTLIGYEVAGVDGVRRFLPQIACGTTTPTSVEVAVPTAMLSAGELAFYRDQGVALSRLDGRVLSVPVISPAAEHEFQHWEIGYSGSGDGVTTAFEASAEDVGGGIAKVRVSGEVDLYTAPELKEALSNAIEGGARSVLVDLSQATFIDSTTLGVLMGARQAAAARRRRARDRLQRPEHPQDLRDHAARPDLRDLRQRRRRRSSISRDAPRPVAARLERAASRTRSGCRSRRSRSRRRR